MDLGRFVEVPVSEVRTNLPGEFLVEAGMAIWCHLEGIILPLHLHRMISSHIKKEVRFQHLKIS